ncbi:MAG: PRC-barrel domain-containing protein [Acidisphaera sp.]|nr:PRC-barrel domain-containing protein [Acidisphaera sp.]
MAKTHGLCSFAAVALCLATPALAQQSTTGHATPRPAATNATMPPGSTVQMGRLQRVDGGWRSSRIVGATVYNDQNQSIGTVNDLIVGQDGKISQAVISVGGFLGMGTKLVGVPFDQLRFDEKSTVVGAAGTPMAVGPAAVGPGTAPIGTGGIGAGVPPANGSAAATAGATGPGVGAGPGGALTGAPGPGGRPANMTTTRIELPGATRDSLRSAPAFTYSG